MPFVEALPLALEAQWRVTHRIDTADLWQPSPCAGWSVGDVLNHSVGVTAKFTAFASGATDRPRTPAGYLLGTDHHRAVRTAIEQSRRAWATVDSSRECSLPFGTFSAGMAAGINLVDVLAHSWDVSVATGVPLEADHGLWVTALAAADALIGPRRDRRHYGPARAVPPGSSSREQFLAALGRVTSWRPDGAQDAGGGSTHR